MPGSNVRRIVALAAVAFTLLAPSAVRAAQPSAPVSRLPMGSSLAASGPSCAPWNSLPGSAGAMPAMAAAGPNDVWAVGTLWAQTTQRGVTTHWDGRQWHVVPSQNPSALDDRLSGVAAVSATDAWAVGLVIYPTNARGFSTSRPLIEHWNGTRWSLVAAPLPHTDYSLTAVTAVSSTDAWAVGNVTSGTGPIILHWDGHTWHAVPGAPLGRYGSALFGVTALAANDAWAVGQMSVYTTTPLIEHWDGRQWRTAPMPAMPGNTSILAGVAAVSSSDVWAVGYADSASPEFGGPLILHWDGSHWGLSPGVASQEDIGLSSITAIAARDVWTAGGSLVEHWDGRQWQATTGPAGGLHALVAVGPNDLWGIGTEFQHLAGPACSPIATPVSTIPLARVGVQGGSMLASGDGPGAIILDSTHGRVLVRDLDGTVSSIDTRRHAVVWHAKLAASGVLAVDPVGGRIFVPSTGGAPEGRVLVLDAVTGQLTHVLGVAAAPSAVAFDQAHQHLFVADPTAVQVFNAPNGAPLATVPISNPTSLAIDESTGRLFVATSEPTNVPFIYTANPTTSITVLDTATGAVVSRVSGMGGILAVDERAGRVYAGYVGVTDTTATIYVGMFDAASGRLLHTYSLGSDGDAYIRDLVADPATHQVFAATFFGLQALDPTTGQVRVFASDATSAIAISAKGDRLYATQVNATNQYGDPVGPGSVSVFAPNTGTRLATAQVGMGPDVVAMDAGSGQTFVLDQLGMEVVAPGFGTLVATTQPSPADPTVAAPGARYFPATHHNLGGAFLAFWHRYGGLDLLGAPLTEPYWQDGHLVQYMERALLQDIDGQVIAAPLGRELTAGRVFARTPAVPSAADRLYFARTGQSLAGRFLTYWQSHHGAVLLGDPISGVVTEGNGDGSGRRYLVQWFENGRLEYHPEQKTTRYAVEVGLVGLQALRQQSWLSQS